VTAVTAVMFTNTAKVIHITDWWWQQYSISL